MESASETPGAMAADEAPCDPSLLPPPPPPPSASSAAASAKRRWSPCTWRYAIEDSQPELPSRPRPPPPPPLTTTAASPSPRAPPHSSPSQPQLVKLPKPPCYNPLHGKVAEDPHRISSSCPPRVRSSASHQPPAQHFKSSRTREVYRKSRHHLLHARPCEEDEQEENGDAEQDDEDFDDYNKLTVYDEEYFKMRRREMSPSELYFCAMCSTKAAENKSGMEPCAYDNS